MKKVVKCGSDYEDRCRTSNPERASKCTCKCGGENHGSGRLSKKVKK